VIQLGVAALSGTLLVKVLYGTALGHRILDRVPDEAWSGVYRLFGVTAGAGVEARQDVDALIVFAVCFVVSLGCVFLFGAAAARVARESARPESQTDSADTT
jgi:hypothetical protein